MVRFGSVRFFAADGVGLDGTGRVLLFFFVDWLRSFGRDAPLLQPIRVWVDCVAFFLSPPFVEGSAVVLPSPYDRTPESMATIAPHQRRGIRQDERTNNQYFFVL